MCDRVDITTVRQSPQPPPPHAFENLIRRKPPCTRNITRPVRLVLIHADKNQPGSSRALRLLPIRRALQTTSIEKLSNSDCTHLRERQALAVRMLHVVAHFFGHGASKFGQPTGHPSITISITGDEFNDRHDSRSFATKARAARSGRRHRLPDGGWISAGLPAAPGELRQHRNAGRLRLDADEQQLSRWARPAGFRATPLSFRRKPVRLMPTLRPISTTLASEETSATG